ncbi:MAG: hypothetical protein A2Y03_08325 [Omnitrophica WOR_2 bacterium GWF2_38_59]|nr:MAG: hypothetical protein A2Y06_01395 [Omnitrophica WOR_2 bacterium GWA2_37_7]OGX25497.1 MAG: hypothetical protein A2Y03_08325 [Omnitrophica WOR_2 bacterium GWF2_38_59]OGX48111.1 MAG: hypothetical protein A2243_02850 [Omnitrophica WOR_2 bacterium RIFOXYA2_FULL_38_17]OGX54281.1 MAG: hypothetical protein A2267_01850 [Omnitrophica WOR_2 bacterium RIFOXYA12_FULL_38_10]OGX58447.1 MAG: hypothetical protein A2306_11190 [Omnitrophica WOR_2 bacterium RIFOXYB2_FULL_38_16]HBG62512.1 hypothetical prote
MWVILALITAIFTSLKDVFGRKIIKKLDPEIAALGWMVFTLPFMYLMLFIEGRPKLDYLFWFYVGSVTIILTIASVCFFKAIKLSDMSISMPMLTFTPVFLLITSPIMLGEFPRPVGLLGIILIVAGAYVINFSDRKIGYFEPFKSLLREKGPRYMLVVAVLYSVGANFDKMAVVKYSMFAYLCAANSCVSLVLLIIVLKKSKNIISQFKFGWPYMLLMGICTTVAFFSQMNAIKMTIVPYVIAIKRTSVVMSSLFGFWIFKEKDFKERIIGVIVMIIGVFIISFYG